MGVSRAGGSLTRGEAEAISTFRSSLLIFPPDFGHRARSFVVSDFETDEDQDTQKAKGAVLTPESSLFSAKLLRFCVSASNMIGWKVSLTARRNNLRPNFRRDSE